MGVTVRIRIAILSVLPRFFSFFLSAPLGTGGVFFYGCLLVRLVGWLVACAWGSRGRGMGWDNRMAEEEEVGVAVEVAVVGVVP